MKTSSGCCCAVCYQAGIAVVIALAAVYAEQVLGFKQAQTMGLLVLRKVDVVRGAVAARAAMQK
jgi:UMF1 family MFS transporter